MLTRLASMFLVLLAIISCSDAEKSKPKDITVGLETFPEVPFPLYGCKKILRDALENTVSFQEKYRAVLNRSDFTEDEFSKADYDAFRAERCYFSDGSGFKDEDICRNEFKWEVIDKYTAFSKESFYDESPRIHDQLRRAAEYTLPSPAVWFLPDPHRKSAIKTLGDKARNLPCSISIAKLLSEKAVSADDYYAEANVYFEPKRNIDIKSEFFFSEGSKAQEVYDAHKIFDLDKDKILASYLGSWPSSVPSNLKLPYRASFESSLLQTAFPTPMLDSSYHDHLLNKFVYKDDPAFQELMNALHLRGASRQSQV